MAKPLRLLHIEDSSDDAALLVRKLRQGGYEPTVERVQTAADLTAALDRESWDFIISDFSMPAFNGTSALAIVRDRGLDVPFVFVSGTIGEETAVDAMRAGANDYVIKGSLRRLVPVIDRELREAGERQLRRHAEVSLRDLVERAPVGIYRSTPDGRMLAANAAFCRMLGYETPEEVLALDLARDLYADPDERQQLLDHDTYSDREYNEVQATWKAKDGRLVSVQLSVRAVRNAQGVVECYETFVKDVTEERRLEAQFLHAQKMEAIGRLAGGVAHDFNNLLTVMLSYSSLLLEDWSDDHPDREEVDEIRKAAEGATSLTRQLLAFSRQQVLEPRLTDLNDVVRHIDKLLSRLLGEDIRVTSSLAADLGTVKVDPGQLEQVIMNLAVNARDAMPLGGAITVETANIDMDEAYVAANHPLARPGPYVMLAVSDTGTGMDEATQARIFEPFFTTKGVGEGTGLGLATVYGIVRQSGGFIWVYSELGHGTSFKVYLPRVDAPAVRAPGAAAPDAARGSETVLVVEDVEAVRSVTRHMLERQGYTVLEAADAEAALCLSAAYDGPIALMLTDIVMPDLDGRRLAEQIVGQRPGLRVLYMSGYTDDAIVHNGLLEAGIAYLQKPFTPAVLGHRVRAVLDGAI